MIKAALRRWLVSLLGRLEPTPGSVIAEHIGLVPGIGRIHVIDELEPGRYPVEVHISRSLLIEANAKMHPRDTANEATVQRIMDCIIYLTAAAILADSDEHA